MPLEWVATHQSVCQACMIFSLVLVLGVSCCCQEMARQVPWNFLLLVTVCEAVLVGFICAMYTGQSVLLAAGVTP